MIIYILGSGTSLPSMSRKPPAYLIRTQESTILLECGSGAITSMVQQGVGLDKLDGVVLTHLHPDHTADLVPLLFAMSNPLCPLRNTDLIIWGPSGIAEHLWKLESIYGPWVRPNSGKIQVVEMKERTTLRVGDLIITAFRVYHSPFSLAYKLTHKDGSVCFSGDTGFCPALAQAACNVDLFLCECSALEEEPVAGHLTASDVGRIAAEAKCSRVILTHLYDHIVQTDPVSRTRRFFSGPVQLAEDGMVLELVC